MPDDPRDGETVFVQASRRRPDMLRGFGGEGDEPARVELEARATATQKARLAVVALATAR